MQGRSNRFVETLVEGVIACIKINRWAATRGGVQDLCWSVWINRKSKDKSVGNAEKPTHICCCAADTDDALRAHVMDCMLWWTVIWRDMLRLTIAECFTCGSTNNQ